MAELDWGRTYLMCPPEHFGVLYEINPWMDAEVAVDPDRAREQWEGLRSTLEAAGATVEVVRHGDGLGWVFDEVVRLAREHRAQIVVDPAGPIGALVPKWQAVPGLDIVTMSTRDMTAACGGFAQALADRAISIRSHDALMAAVASSRRRPVGDAWALRRAGGGDICPVVAAVAAHWQATRRPDINLADQIF